MTAARILKVSETNATIRVGDVTLDCPIVEGTEGERAIDISKLRAATGLITLDHGFMNTGACTSEITFLNGEEGILHYRGHTIEELCDSSNFLDVAYLLINGDLPKANDRKVFLKAIQDKSGLPEQIETMIRSMPKSTHPMATLGAATTALSGFYPDLSESELSAEQKNEAFGTLMAAFKDMVSLIYRSRSGEKTIASNPNAEYCEDFLTMMFGKKPSESVTKALDVLLILHADHEQNCSTSTVRLIGSSKASIFASIAGGVGALWGPLHGGANQAVLEMLEAIHSEGGDTKAFLARAKDKNDTFRLMGFGHRVYKNFDPRANLIKGHCDLVLEQLGVKDPLLQIAKGLEQEALKDNYFVDRKLYPNVDFYSGIIYRALGIPTEMFTAMFALGRLPGWLAQWKEMRESADTKIGRPRQIYVGNTVG